MYSATLSEPIALEELGWANTTYLGTGISVWDPLMIWGTMIEVEPLEAFLKEQRHASGRIISPAHVLVSAVARSLRRHPKLNRRIVGRRVYPYDGVNVVVPILQTRRGEARTLFLRNVDRMSLSQISESFWIAARGNAARVTEARKTAPAAGRFFSNLPAAGRWLHVHWLHKMSWLGFYVANRFRVPTVWPWQQELNGAGALVNYLGFRGAPPMCFYKASCLPMNSISVGITMGPSESRPVAVDDEIVIRRQAPLFVRTDHRMVNAFEAADFISTLRGLLADPCRLIEGESGQHRHEIQPVAVERTTCA